MGVEIYTMRSALLAKSLLTQQDRKLLLETRNILDELLETEEVLRDRALMESISQSRRDVKTGSFYSIAQLKQQLRRKGKL